MPKKVPQPPSPADCAATSTSVALLKLPEDLAASLLLKAASRSVADGAWDGFELAVAEAIAFAV